MKLRLSVLTLFVILFLLFVPSFFTSRIFAETANHVVISEVQTGQSGTGNTTKEFVELYNPTSDAVDLTGWRLSRRTGGGSLGNLVTVMSGSIPAHGYFLISHEDYDGSVSADLVYTTASSIASNSTVILYSDAGVTIVDKVGFGTGDDLEFEELAVENPDLDGSIERKACGNSTASSMVNGDSLNGNAWDTNNNANDFVLRLVSEPQNSSTTETPACTTSSPSPTPTVSPTATPSPTPTASPTATPIPTATPSPTPTASPTPTMSPTPTASPTPTLSPTPTPTVVPSMTPSPTPSSTPRPIFSNFSFRMECKVRYITYRGRFFRMNIPRIYCSVLPN